MSSDKQDKPRAGRRDDSRRPDPRDCAQQTGSGDIMWRETRDLYPHLGSLGREQRQRWAGASGARGATRLATSVNGLPARRAPTSRARATEWPTPRRGASRGSRGSRTRCATRASTVQGGGDTSEAQ